MKVLVSGSHGLVGGHLLPSLKAEGHEVTRLIRRDFSERSRNVGWSPESGRIEKDRLRDIHAVVHLAGENIAGGRWNAGRKEGILQSRVKGTRLLAETLAAMHVPPKVMICASGVGYYGSRGDEILDEDSARGAGFLSEVCEAWEAAAEPARRAGIRVVHLRLGVVLSSLGGVLRKMIPPFQACLGGRLGTGRQWMSWIAVQDVTRSILHLMNTPVAGVFNLVAPNPVTNADFTRALASALRRPALLPVPAFALNTLMGREMASELLLSSTRAVPRRLIEAGYAFRFKEVSAALQTLIRYHL
ncbi:MAG: TIGR01777 family oxidoreductase [Kiritimatiellia bacterium]